MKYVKPLMLITDIGFILYWFVTLLHLIPEEAAFKDYHNPVIVAWNWSFLPLDILISISGLISLYLHKKKRPLWKNAALISLVLTFCSGLQAIAFWAFRGDFDPVWWSFNLFLMIYPLCFFRIVVTENTATKDHFQAGPL
ncbi:YvaD family protein [Bacillus paralicheniformis]|uniref:YvaD family protein n=1 Tax=Bacillus paralicheniformis TaxID=1648923 RepID=UPI001322AE3B|nr:YvaD family protein [Bacillus paralicheniformis]MPQ26912.1 hypothetical protein [Bacillus paralicheniformis]